MERWKNKEDRKSWVKVFFLFFFPFLSTHIDISHHFFCRNGGIDTSYAALVNVNVQLDALEPPQKEYNRYWRDARKNDDDRYSQHPAGIRGGYSYALKTKEGKKERKKCRGRDVGILATRYMGHEIIFSTTHPWRIPRGILRLLHNHGDYTGDKDADHDYGSEKSPGELPIHSWSVSCHLLDIFRESEKENWKRISLNSILNRLFERKRLDNISILLFVTINKDDGNHFHERDHHETDGTCETVEHL